MRRFRPPRQTLLLLGFGLLAYGRAAAASAALEGAACHLTLRADLPATVVPGFGVVVAAKINSFPVKLGVSTEPTVTFINQQFVDSHHLRSVPVARELALADGPLIARDVLIDTLRLGMIEIHDSRILAPTRLSGPSTETVQHRLTRTEWSDAAAGTLGPKFLSQYDVEFDLAAQRVRLYDHENCTGAPQPWPGILLESGFGPAQDLNAARYGASPNGLPIEIPAMLNGQTGSVTLDSIHGENLMTLEAAEHIGIRNDSAGVTRLPDTHQNPPIRYYHALINSVAIGNETVNNVNVTVYDRYITHDDFLREVSLGVGFFQANHVYIAYAAKRIYFTPYSFTDARK